MRQKIDFDPEITEKVGQSLVRTHILRSLEGNVSPKVGSTETRDYSVRRPKLKIGSDNFVDTYSVFWSWIAHNNLLTQLVNREILNNYNKQS